MSKVTVIIPNYNGEKFLPDCLDSLLNRQNDSLFRILVVDNGSTDKSLALLEEDYPSVKCISLPENTGFCHAVNVGIMESDTPYVLLLNNDTKVLDGFVENLYDSIEAKKNAFSVSARMLMWDDPTLLDGAGDRYCALGWSYARGKGKAAKDYNRFGEVFSACGGAAIYRKSVLDEIGLFDENHFAYLEDLDIGYRAKINGYRNYYEPAAQVIHFGSAASGSRYNAWKTELAAANNVYVIYKNMPLLQLILNMPLLISGFVIKYFFFLRKGFGASYARGIKKGLKKSFSKEGKKKKQGFILKNWKSYIRIQWQLYAGILQFIMKS